MDDFEPIKTPREISREETTDYIYDMIEQMARLARKSGDAHVALHLEAIIATRLATAERRAAG